MRRPTRIAPVLTAYRVFVGLCVAGASASASRASAQPPIVPLDGQGYVYAVGIGPYACVDPADALAARRFQDEPCKLPLYHLPRTAIPGLAAPPGGQPSPRGSSAKDLGHAMFWRFPLQPLAPNEVPRHGRR